jgi:mono/diheme cytochrome c family protein
VKEGKDSGKNGVGGNQAVVGASKRGRKAAVTETKKGLVLVLAVAALGWAVRARGSGAVRRARDREQAATGAKREQLFAKGKGIFVAKCARCHNERGDKELSSGKPLRERGLGTAAIAKAVNGRLSKGTDEERRAVALYVASLMNTAAKAEAEP